MRRGILWMLLVVGLALVIAPIAMGMFGKASDGEAMVNDFRPIMQPASVEKTVEYYALFQQFGADFGTFMTEDNVASFQQYMQGIGAMSKEFPQMLSAVAGQLGMTDAQLQAFLAQDFPAVAGGLQAFPQMGQDFSQVVGVMAQDVVPFQDVQPALTHYGDLVQRMERNVGTYASVDALPPMGLFPWFFIVPGILIVLGAGYLLVADMRAAKAPALAKTTAPAH